MRPSPRHSVGLSLVACVLTLAASGDDLNLARLVLPGAFAGVPPGALPDDDDNTDFTPSPRPAAPEEGRVCLQRNPALAGCLPPTAEAGPSAFGPPGATRFRGAAGKSHLSFVPMRC